MTSSNPGTSSSDDPPSSYSISSYYAAKKPYTDLLKATTDKMTADISSSSPSPPKPPTDNSNLSSQHPTSPYPYFKDSYTPVDASLYTSNTPETGTEETIPLGEVFTGWAAMVKKARDEDMKGKDKEAKEHWARIDRLMGPGPAVGPKGGGSGGGGMRRGR